MIDNTGEEIKMNTKCNVSVVSSRQPNLRFCTNLVKGFDLIGQWQGGRESHSYWSTFIASQHISMLSIDRIHCYHFNYYFTILLRIVCSGFWRKMLLFVDNKNLYFYLNYINWLLFTRSKLISCWRPWRKAHISFISILFIYDAATKQSVHTI